MNFKAAALAITATAATVFGGATAAQANGYHQNLCEANLEYAIQYSNQASAPQGLYITGIQGNVTQSNIWGDAYWNGHQKVTGCGVQINTNRGPSFLRYNVEIDQNGGNWIGTSGWRY